MNNKKYNTIGEYINYSFRKNGLSLEIRKINDKLFIEKMLFLEEENRDDIFIHKELINYENYEIIKKIPAYLRNDNELKIVHSFRYLNTQEISLIYVIWIDSSKNIIKTKQKFVILNDGDIFRVP
jgi:hypothetical protein